MIVVIDVQPFGFQLGADLASVPLSHRAVIQHTATFIDDALQKGWPLKRIDAILRAVLRAGSYELEHRKDVPGRVVVSEYVDVAHAFVEKEETGMVNAVLDQIARQFRADEFARG